jgi:hypothetical protein
MVVIPATVERLMPTPAAKLPLILPVMVDALKIDAFKFEILADPLLKKVEPGN